MPNVVKLLLVKSIMLLLAKGRPTRPRTRNDATEATAARRGDDTARIRGAVEGSCRPAGQGPSHGDPRDHRRRDSRWRLAPTRAAALVRLCRGAAARGRLIHNRSPASGCGDA